MTKNNIKPPIDAKVSETTENYLKRIHILNTQMGKARLSDIAKTMDRSLSSTSEAVKRMAAEGYLIHEKYGSIELTDKGLAVAEGIHENYTAIHELLATLGVPEDIAVIDACSMEHSINDKTIEIIQKFLKYTQTPLGKSFLDEFKKI